MSVSRSTYSIYGVHVDDANWLALEEDPGQCCNDGAVGYFTAGRYDDSMTFLAVRWEEVEPGQYKMVDPLEDADNPLIPWWNGALLTCAERLGLNVLAGPGWFVIPDES